MAKLYLTVVLSVLCFLGTQAQTLNVKSFAVKANDITARTQPRQDINGNDCALVKVQLAAPNVFFEGNVIGDVAYNTSEYHVYMANGSKRVTIKLEGYLPLEVIFEEFGINKLESKTVYLLVLSIPHNNNEIKKNEIFMVNGISFKMIYVEGGTIQIGATQEQFNTGFDEMPVHEVTVSSYYIEETEVTQDLWEAVMGNNPSNFKGEKHPVEFVSWYDCIDFINKLNQLTNRKFRLPTETEWEYAARGGKNGRKYLFSGNNEFRDVGWCKDNIYSSHTREVKSKKSNELGIYDMSGNVSEWVQDWKGVYPSSAQINPLGPSSGNSRVNRGGGWSSAVWGCRVASRRGDKPESKSNSLGLRLAL